MCHVWCFNTKNTIFGNNTAVRPQPSLPVHTNLYVQQIVVLVHSEKIRDHSRLDAVAIRPLKPCCMQKNKIKIEKKNAICETTTTKTTTKRCGNFFSPFFCVFVAQKTSITEAKRSIWPPITMSRRHKHIFKLSFVLCIPLENNISEKKATTVSQKKRSEAY